MFPFIRDAAPVAAAELTAEADDLVADAAAEEALLPVSAGPEEAEDVGSAVPELADPVVVADAVAADLRRSSPAVMVTGNTSSVKSLTTPV